MMMKRVLQGGKRKLACSRDNDAQLNAMTSQSGYKWKFNWNDTQSEIT